MIAFERSTPVLAYSSRPGEGSSRVVSHPAGSKNVNIANFGVGIVLGHQSPEGNSSAD